MTTIFKQPNLPPEIRNIQNDLQTLQKEVGGYIEAVHIDRSIVLLVDEEGLFKPVEFNFFILGHRIVGNAIFVGVDTNGDFRSLTKNELNKVLSIL